MTNFCSAKDTVKKKDIVKRMKTQAIDWEKIFAICISEKGLVSKIFKEYLKLNNNNKNNNPILKMAENLNIYLTKDDI